MKSNKSGPVFVRMDCFNSPIDAWLLLIKSETMAGSFLTWVRKPAVESTALLLPGMGSLFSSAGESVGASLLTEEAAPAALFLVPVLIGFS